MKHPFWFINSALLFLLFFVLGFFYFAGVAIPMREATESTPYTKIKKQQTLQINIHKIYENDLFDTYIKENPPIEAEAIAPLPEPPTPLPVTIPELPKPHFLEPLNITLKGIIAIRNDSSQNRAIIADSKTLQETIYKTGDLLEDAQLIRIFGNKVIFLRSNGQQEVLYVREQDAELDPAYIKIENWDLVAQKIAQNDWIISRKEFGDHVQSLAELIDLIGLTTAYKKGKSIGCRVGFITPKSLGEQLGLQTGDIILSINEITANTTENRLKIYKNVVAAQDDDTITIKLVRKNQEYIQNYKIKEFIKDPNKELFLQTEQQVVSLEKIQEEEKKKILKEQYKFAPTLEEIRAREKSNMLNKGKAPQPKK